jgi:hypothetical protein
MLLLYVGVLLLLLLLLPPAAAVAGVAPCTVGQIAAPTLCSFSLHRTEKHAIPWQRLSQQKRREAVQRSGTAP